MTAFFHVLLLKLLIDDDSHVFENAIYLIINCFSSVFCFRERFRRRCLIDFEFC